MLQASVSFSKISPLHFIRNVLFRVVLDPAPEETKRLVEGFVESWWRILKRFLWMILIWYDLLNIYGEVEMDATDSRKAWETTFIEFRTQCRHIPPYLRACLERWCHE